MATIINNPAGGGENSSDSGLGFILGIVIAIILIILFFVYGLPYLRRSQGPAPTISSTNINLTVPTPKEGGNNTTTPPTTNNAPAY